MLNDDKLKPATTILQQIQILKSRGLIINSEKTAATLLSYIHYYRLSAYCIGLQLNNSFRPGVTIEQIYRIYRFDEDFRRLLINAIEPIEIKLRATIANHMALKYGNICYKDSSLFANERRHSKFLEKHESAVEQMKDCAFIAHHKKIYGDFPLWVAIETWSFGQTSKLFGNMISKDQKAISLCFGIDNYYFSGWLECLCYIRNICAHNGRIYNRIIVKKPKLFNDDAQYFSLKIFPCLLMIKRIYHGRGSAWRMFIDNLRNLIEEYSLDIDLSFIGFPTNWNELLD